VDVAKCPRCTMGHINSIFEQELAEDSMMVDFI